MVRHNGPWNLGRSRKKVTNEMFSIKQDNERNKKQVTLENRI